nr:MAG TPA: hypothetical protein [Caudoviricetes sp.]
MSCTVSFFFRNSPFIFGKGFDFSTFSSPVI